MLPSSHLEPINHEPVFTSCLPAESSVSSPVDTRQEALLLADAFSEFIAASGRLEGSYRDLQAEVAQLGSKLADRNAALEASLLENEQMRLALVEIVDCMPCGVLVLGETGTILRINPEACCLLQLAPQCLPGNLCDLAAASPFDLAPFCLVEGRHELSFCSNENLDGVPAQRWVELRTRRLSGGNSQAAAIVTLSDLTAHKDAEQDREKGRRAAALAEVAATLAHEVRNPLASLELFVGLLEEDNSRTAEWVGHLRAGLRGLAATVNNVLSFHGTSESRLRPVRLGIAVAAATAFVRPLIEQSGLCLRLAGCELAGTILGDEAGLRQLILNLVMNAVRHTPSPGTVSITVQTAGTTHLRLAIADTGCGIGPAQLPFIFETGWSGSGDRSGLGLAVCRKIAAQHGAPLRVCSEAGRGTTFEMEIPLV